VEGLREWGENLGGRDEGGEEAWGEHRGEQSGGEDGGGAGEHARAVDTASLLDEEPKIAGGPHPGSANRKTSRPKNNNRGTLKK